MGGALGAIESGFMQSEIHESAYRYQRAVENRERIVVGVNQFQTAEEGRPRTLQIDETAEAAQVARLKALRERRDDAAVRRALADLAAAASGNDNVMPPILAAVEAYATLGEICNVLRAAFGEYHQPTAIV